MLLVGGFVRLELCAGGHEGIGLPSSEVSVLVNLNRFLWLLIELALVILLLFLAHCEFVEVGMVKDQIYEFVMAFVQLSYES